jgi:hypothetical protein
MTIPEALEKIGKALAVLTHQTDAENRAGMFSKNRLTEDLLLPVFRLALKAPHLRNVNQKVANYPYIDLADDKSRLAIQVTVERGASKVTETLTNFVSNDYQKRYKKLIFFVLTGTKLHYATKSKLEWKKICGKKLRFDPTSDIITTLDLYPIIQGLSNAEIYELRDILSQSVFGEESVDVESYLVRQSRRQLELEKSSGKYIPEVFVETRETKSLARCFAHPALFFRHTLDSLGRLNIPGWNRLLAKAGLPPLVFPELASRYSKHLLADVIDSATDLSEELTKFTTVVKKYHGISGKSPPPFPVRKDRKHFYEQNTYTLQSSLGWGLNHRIEDLFDELSAARAQIFILTGKAGQGKTNLVCDFVENFLWKHKVPCAYLSGRRISAMKTTDAGDAIQRLIFEGKTKSFADVAKLLSAHSDRANKPFVFIIDGLNEHHRINEFAEQLEQFIEAVIEHPNLKLFLTCRSEFFRLRFGNLLKGKFAEHTFLLEANEHRLEEACHDEMLAGYFKFFKVRQELLSEHVIKSLKRDILLLRFFCEAYGALDKPKSYRQKWIGHIYREQIFEIYLERKLGSADAFLQDVTGKTNPLNSKADLRAVLACCMKHMLDKWQFGNVPISIIPANLQDALCVLLDEELILRRDAPPGASIFSPSQETINFTFDEFRDFLLAQYLIAPVFVSDHAAFEKYIAQHDPKDSQTIEGIKRFLFYASRHKKNEDFLKYYRDQPWYKDVYDTEVFNLDPSELRPDDEQIIIEALQAGGERAREFARLLAVNWDATSFPILNLDLLLSFLVKADDSQFDNLVIETFKTIRNFNDGISASAFCKFIREKVLLPTLKPSHSSKANSLFQFLIFLLPVDDNHFMDSESDRTFRVLLETHPAYAIRLMRDALNHKTSRLQPYVWRLLTSGVKHLSRNDHLLVQANEVKNQYFLVNHVLNREIGRFIDAFNSTFNTPTK